MSRQHLTAVMTNITVDKSSDSAEPMSTTKWLNPKQLIPKFEQKSEIIMDDEVTLVVKFPDYLKQSYTFKVWFSTMKTNFKKC